MDHRRTISSLAVVVLGLALLGCENDDELDPTEEVPPVEAPREEETS